MLMEMMREPEKKKEDRMIRRTARYLNLKAMKGAQEEPGWVEK